jgi:hypothetical protein
MILISPIISRCNRLTGVSLLVTPISGQRRLMMIGEIEVFSSSV